jgi:hypothetical protein
VPLGQSMNSNVAPVARVVGRPCSNVSEVYLMGPSISVYPLVTFFETVVPEVLLVELTFAQNGPWITLAQE